jgi:Immunity protein 50
MFPNDSDEILGAIEGAGAIIDWFGKWPSFHDAEIVDVYLARARPSWLRLHFWKMNWEAVDRSGQEAHAIVTFVFTGITDLELADFSPQNVISSLWARRSAGGGIRLFFAPCYGLAGYIEASGIRVELTPGLPDDRRDR